MIHKMLFSRQFRVLTAPLPREATPADSSKEHRQDRPAATQECKQEYSGSVPVAPLGWRVHHLSTVLLADVFTSSPQFSWLACSRPPHSPFGWRVHPLSAVPSVGPLGWRVHHLSTVLLVDVFTTSPQSFWLACPPSLHSPFGWRVHPLSTPSPPPLHSPFGWSSWLACPPPLHSPQRVSTSSPQSFRLACPPPLHSPLGWRVHRVSTVLKISSTKQAHSNATTVAIPADEWWGDWIWPVLASLQPTRSALLASSFSALAANGLESGEGEGKCLGPSGPSNCNQAKAMFLFVEARFQPSFV